VLVHFLALVLVLVLVVVPALVLVLVLVHVLVLVLVLVLVHATLVVMSGMSRETVRLGQTMAPVLQTPVAIVSYSGT
jgi:hypothetical protein